MRYGCVMERMVNVVLCYVAGDLPIPLLPSRSRYHNFKGIICVNLPRGEGGVRNGCVVNANDVRCDVTPLAISHPCVHAKLSLLLYHFTGLICVVLPGDEGGVRQGCECKGWCVMVF